MSTIRTLMMIAAVTAGAAACHDKAAGKPAGTEQASGAEAPTAGKPARTPELVPEADAQRFYTFVEQLVTVAVANQDDCTKLAAATNAHIEANTALINDAAVMHKAHKEMPPAIKDRMAKKFSAELAPAIARKCAKDPAVMAAFAKLRTR